MNADLIVQPIDEIRAAVDTLAAGLGRGEVIAAEFWDRSVVVLARCHDQVGGDTRRRLYAMFEEASAPDGPGDVCAKVRELAGVLGACPARTP